jgi:hypothetical protein
MLFARLAKPANFCARLKSYSEIRKPTLLQKATISPCSATAHIIFAFR